MGHLHEGGDETIKQTRPLVSEGASHRQNSNCLTATKIWSSPGGAQHQDGMAGRR